MSPRRKRRIDPAAAEGTTPDDALAALTGEVPATPDTSEIAALTTRHRAGATSAPGPEPIAPRMRALRFPALLVVIGLLVGAALVERREVEPSSVATVPSDLSRLMPVANPGGAASSTFFCAGGTARGSTDPAEPGADPGTVPDPVAPASPPGTAPGTTAPATDDDTTGEGEGATSEGDDDGATTDGEGAPGDEGEGEATGAPEPAAPVVAEHTVLIGNLGDAERRVVVTAMPSEGETVVTEVTVAGRTRTEVDLTELVTAPFVAALVEADGGAVAVDHQLDGPTGRSIAPCASSASSTWYFPAGATRRNTRHVYAVFNPFPQQAVVDFHFVVEEEGGRQATRDSDRLEGIVVPAGRVVAVDITDIITVRDQISTTVRTRSGLGSVVVDQLQVSEARSDWPENLAVTLGAPAPATTWTFADNRPLGEGVETTYVAFNPSDTDAELELFVVVDGQVAAAPPEPFVVTARAGQYAEVVLGTDNRIPEGFGAFVVAVSGNGVPVVVERVQRQLDPAEPDGAAYTMGSPLLAREWLAPTGGVEGQTAMQVSIANPSVSEAVTLTVEAVGEGDAAALEDYDQVELAPGGRTVVDLGDAQGAAALLLRITASGPVVAGQWFSFEDPGTLSSAMLFPLVGTLVLPGGEVTDRGSLVEVVPPEPFEGTIPPGTFPGTVPGTDPTPPDTEPEVPPEESTTTTAAEGTPPETDPATGAPVDPATATTEVPPPG